MALTLFMIIFAGIMTFMQANVITTARSSSRAKAVNVAASYIEQVRALPYTSIGTPGNTEGPEGVLSEQNFTQGGINFHVVPTVTWIDDPSVNGPGDVTTTHDLKRVVVTVTATAGGASSPLAATTYALESIVSKAGGQSQPTALPTVAFDVNSPDAGTYVSGIQHVGAIATVNAEDAVLTNLNMYGDSDQKGLLFSPTFQVAQWPPLPWGNMTFDWDTAAVDASGTRLFPDGPRNLTLQVFDSFGKVAFVVRSVFVVNTAPSVPNVVLTASSATTLMGSWNICRSGSIDAVKYEWDIFDQNSGTGAWQHQSGDNPPYSDFTTSTSVPISKPVRLDRYKLLVRAYSPPTANNLTGFISDWGAGYAVTRPVLSSLEYANSYASSGNLWTTVISSPNPSSWTAYFPTSSMSTQYYRNSTMSTATATAITLPYTFTTSQNKNTGPPTAYYYAAKVTVQPSSNDGGAPTDPVTVWSNWVGPNGFDSGQNTSDGTMTFSGW